MKVRADQLFESEQYVQATPLYLHILSLEPTIADWNFRYGACLLYNSNNKSTSLRYLNYGVSDPNCDPRAYYFLGRGLHLDYQFDAAKKAYQTYASKRAKTDSRYPVEREMQMCDNGKHLLTTFTDIIVAEKQEIKEDRFYEIYSDSKTIGGTIINNYDFQSKIDKKKGHVPTVHFPPNAQRIFYASYGDKEDSGLDIYMRIRLPNDKWGDPQMVRGGVNSKEDENYPYMHPSGKYLYFSSKGHNSMGGYDVFMSRYDAESNQFGTPENVDFAISSPDDDLFYVVDSLFENAYFASARSSESGKLHVYRVRVARVPIQEVIVMGDFVSTIHPKDQKITIQFVKHSNGEDLDKMKADAAKGGKYSYVFPQGGKYDYIIDVEGSGAQYKFTVEFPFLDELRPLKQRITHTLQNGEEIVKIENLFDENVEGAEAIIAQVIRKKSELDVNIDQFDLEELNAGQEQEKILAELGFNKMSLDEVSGQLEEITEKVLQTEELADRITTNVASELVAKADRVKSLESMEKELREKALNTSDPALKHKLLTEASQKQQEKETLLAKIDGLNALIESIDTEMRKGAVDPEKLAELQATFDGLKSEDGTKALNVLAENKAILEDARKASPNGVMESYVTKTTDLRKEINTLNERRNDYKQTVTQLESRIQILERQKDGASKKELESINGEIASISEELTMTQTEIESVTARIKKLELDLNVTEDQLASLQNAISTEEKGTRTVPEAQVAVKEVAKIAEIKPFDYEKELAAIELEHPEVTGGDPIVDWVEKIGENHAEKRAEILGDPSLTELERTSQQIENNNEAIAAIDQRLANLKAQGSGDNSEEIQALNAMRSEQKQENIALKERELELKKETPDAALSKEDVLAEIAGDLQKQLTNLEKQTNLKDREKITKEIQLLEQIDQQITDELANVEEQLKSDPNNEELIARQVLLNELAAETKTSLENSRANLAALPEEIVPVVTTPQDVIAQLDGGYESRMAAIEQSNDPPMNREKALLQENEALQSKLEKEEAALVKQLKKDPENADLKEEKAALEQAQLMLDEEIAERNQTITALENAENLANQPTKESVIASVDPSYQERLQAIESGSGSPLEKLQEAKSVQETFLNELIRENGNTNKLLKKNPNDANLKAKSELIQSLIAETQASVQEKSDEIAQINASSTSNEQITAETVRKDIAPEFETALSAINQNSNTPIEKEKEFIAVYESLLDQIRDEIASVESQITSNPNDAKLTEKQRVLRELERQAQADLANHEQRLKTLEQENNAPNVVSESTVLEALAPNYEQDLAAIEAAPISSSEKAKRRAVVEAGLLEQLQVKSEGLESKMETNPNDPSLSKEFEIVQNLIGSKSNDLQEAQEQAVNAMTVDEKEDLIAAIAPKYGDALSKAKTKEAQLAAEKNLEEELQDAIAAKQKQQQRKYSVTVAIEQAQLEVLLEENQSRIQALEATEIVSDENSFVENLRSELNAKEALTSEKTDVTSLKEQDRQLAVYEERLTEQIDELQSELEIEKTDEKEQELTWLNAEKERVVRKRRQVEISIGELEQGTIANVDPTLDQKKREIESQLASENLSKSEETALRKELKEVQHEQTVQENVVLETTNADAQRQTENLQESLDKAATNDKDGVISRVQTHANKEEEAISNLEESASKAGTEEEKNYLLETAQARREQLNDDLNNALADQELRKLEEEYDIQTSSPEALQTKKRQFTIEIGEISRDIQRVDSEIAAAKRKEIPALQEEREILVAKREQVMAQLEQVDKQLSEQEVSPQPVDPSALEASVSFNEERKIASSDAYKEYQPLAREVLIVANDIRTLEKELDSERLELQRLVSSGSEEEAVVLKAREIQQLEGALDAKRIELTQKKYIADQALPTNEEEAMKIQNLVARGIQPLKVAVAAAAILQMPTNGLAIDTVARVSVNEIAAIPVGVENPTGLVYRVQVGAFARPLRDDVFREFNPVSGELIEGTNVTRYMAGYFNSTESGSAAREQIRELGYSDAFLVAYCNGERVSIGEARRLEAEGICVPKRTEEIMIEVAENTAEKMGIPMTAELEEVPEWTYNQAANSIPADPIERMKGLFFTVQIGVFNRPVEADEVFNLPNIMTYRLPNGQIRYNTGIFDSAEDALPRQKLALQSGVQGAFIVAYYAGERISIANARRLLNEQGLSILQSRQNTAPIETNSPNSNVTVIDSTEKIIDLAPMEEWEMRVQIVSKKTFDEFPRDVLNRYNAEGYFYFDESDKKVKSVIYKNVDYLPRLWNFKDDVDTVYIPEGLLEDQQTSTIGFVFRDSLIPGDFMDWMLRCSYRREIFRSYKGAEIRIFGVPKDLQESVMKQIRVFGVEPELMVEEELKEGIKEDEE